MVAAALRVQRTRFVVVFCVLPFADESASERESSVLRIHKQFVRHGVLFADGPPSSSSVSVHDVFGESEQREALVVVRESQQCFYALGRDG